MRASRRSLLRGENGAKTWKIKKRKRRRRRRRRRREKKNGGANKIDAHKKKDGGIKVK